MAKIAVIVLAGKETHEGLGRVANALEAVKELKGAGDEVQLIFDGAGTEWVPELSNPEHMANPLFSSVRDRIVGVCDFCAGAFGVKEKVGECKLPLLSEFEGHPSIRKLISGGYQIITF